MYQVIKRDGHAAEFNISRISSAIMKAFDVDNVRIVGGSGFGGIDAF